MARVTKKAAKPAPASKPPFTLEGIDHILLLVSGMKPATRFYTDVLGCTVEGALPQYGMLQLRAGAALIDLVDVAAPEASWARPPVAGGLGRGVLGHQRAEGVDLRAQVGGQRVQVGAGVGVGVDGQRQRARVGQGGEHDRDQCGRS